MGAQSECININLFCGLQCCGYKWREGFGVLVFGWCWSQPRRLWWKNSTPSGGHCSLFCFSPIGDSVAFEYHSSPVLFCYIHPSGSALILSIDLHWIHNHCKIINSLGKHKMKKLLRSIIAWNAFLRVPAHFSAQISGNCQLRLEWKFSFAENEGKQIG